MINDESEPLGVLELEGNLADVEKPPVPKAGKYVGEIQDVKVQTSGKGNNYYSVLFVVPSSELAADIAEHYEDGLQLYWNRQLVPARNDRRALFNLRKFVEALGLDTNTSAIDPNDWMGQKAVLVTKVSRYNGEDRLEISAIETAERAAPTAAKRGGRK